jgi:adenylosuccinate lyase
VARARHLALERRARRAARRHDPRLPRQAAYVLVQRSALAAIQEAATEGQIGAKPGRFRALLGADPEIAARLDGTTLDALFDLDHHLRHAPAILERALGGPSGGDTP